MAWRSVLIQNPARLRLQHSQFLVEQEGGESALPLEDLTAVILDHPQITLTAALLAAAQKNGVVVVCCDEKHMPNGLLLPFHQHSRQAEVTALQQSWTQPFCKRTWQRIVRQKILNQAQGLERAGTEGAKHLRALAARVASGDPENREAQAARHYFPRLFGPRFTRTRPDWTNAALNYGYAVARAVVARSVVAYGLIPSWGLHHGNNLNAFNLADDLMEAFRPLVDGHVAQARREDATELDKGDRARLAEIGHALCRVGEETHSLTNAADRLAASLVAASRDPAAPLELPAFAS